MDTGLHIKTAGRYVLSASAGGISRAYLTCFFLAEALGYFKKNLATSR